MQPVSLAVEPARDAQSAVQDWRLNVRGGHNPQWPSTAGNLAGLALAPILLQKVGWRGLFFVFGLLGGPLLAVWTAVVPPQIPTVRPSGGSAPPLSAMQMMSKPATWAIIVVNVVNHWGAQCRMQLCGCKRKEDCSLCGGTGLIGRLVERQLSQY